MATEIFQDSEDRAWAIKLTFGDLKRVLTLTGVNLAKPGKHVSKESDLTKLDEDSWPTYLRLANDPILLMDVVYSILEPQAKEKKISSENFGQAITPTVFKDMFDKFWRVYHDFFLEAGDQMGAKMVEGVLKMRALEAKQVSKVDAAMDRAIEEAEKKIEDQIETILQ